VTTRFADHLLTGTHAARPAVSAVPVGTLYSCTTHLLIYQSDGSSWAVWAVLNEAGVVLTTRGDLLTSDGTGLVRLPAGADGQMLVADATQSAGLVWRPPGYGATANVGAVFDGGGAALVGNPEVDVIVPTNGTITGWTLVADVAGSAQVDVRRVPFASYPPTAADSIAGTSPPALSGAIKAQGSPTGWVTAFAAGDIFRFRLVSASGVGRLTVALSYTRS
jgi:hypothetical protein